MKIIDFRSDTVTRPTLKMKEAMFQAEVGDDVYQDDPTVIELEKRAAKMTGFEAGLFVVSGTMGNQLAIMSQTQRGDEMIIGEDHHILKYEVGAMAVLSSVVVKSVPGFIKEPSQITQSIRATNIHFPPTTLVCLENALSNGQVIPPQQMQTLIQTAKAHDLAVHVDGARIFNSAIACQCDVADFVKDADSMMFCLSKGLAAPIGSILVGSQKLIDKARKNRKILGGGWRQAGVIAASGIVALNDMVERLKEDHDHAQHLAAQLNTLSDLYVFKDQLDINMVFFKFKKDIDHQHFVAAAKANGILINGPNADVYRLMTHKDINHDDLNQCFSFIASYIKN